MQDHQALQHMAVRKELLGCELCSFKRADSDGRLMGDEARDSTGFTRLAHHVHRLWGRKK